MNPVALFSRRRAAALLTATALAFGTAAPAAAEGRILLTRDAALLALAKKARLGFVAEG